MFGLTDGLLKHQQDHFNIYGHNSLLVVLLIRPCGRDVNIQGYPLSIHRFNKMKSAIYVYYIDTSGIAL